MVLTHRCTPASANLSQATASALVRHLAQTGKPVLAYTIFIANAAYRATVW
ncbi:hypothetical protein BSP239C_01600 [Brevibacterium sp. 239c]|nr:hypothetical protein BSP239C_01600 [Brevibacterium sp. 239c]